MDNAHKSNLMNATRGKVRHRWRGKGGGNPCKEIEEQMLVDMQMQIQMQIHLQIQLHPTGNLS